MNDRHCRHCQQFFQPGPYRPQQAVCSRASCQRQRRRDYHRQKVASDPVYRQVCVESARKWRQAHSGYWKPYRQTHPQQVEQNRQRQWRCDQKHRLAKLANNTPLVLLPSPIYKRRRAEDRPDPRNSLLGRGHMLVDGPLDDRQQTRGCRRRPSLLR